MRGVDLILLLVYSSYVSAGISSVFVGLRRTRDDVGCSSVFRQIRCVGLSTKRRYLLSKVGGVCFSSSALVFRSSGGRKIFIFGLGSRGLIDRVGEVNRKPRRCRGSGTVTISSASGLVRVCSVVGFGIGICACGKRCTCSCGVRCFVESFT